MNKKILLAFVLFGVITIWGGASASAQESVVGKYSHRMSIDEGRNSLDLIFEIKARNVAVYRNEQNGDETQKRFGSWTYNKRQKQITVTLPPVKRDPIMGQGVKLTFVFNVIGKNLKLMKDLPYKDGKGEIYKRQN